MSSANKDRFNYFHSNLDLSLSCFLYSSAFLLYSFVSSLYTLEPPIIFWTQVVRAGMLTLFFILRENIQSLPSWPPNRLGKFPSSWSLVWVYIRNIWFFKAFSDFIEMIMWFTVESTLHSFNEPKCRACIIYLYIFKFAKILLRMFAFMFMRDISLL